MYEHDEEAGELPMCEVDRTTPVQVNFGSTEVKEATLVPLPPSTGPSPSNSSSSPAHTPSNSQHTPTTDPLFIESQVLLADTTAIERPPTEPTEAALSSTILTPTPVEPSDPESYEPEVVDQSQPSIRLVGGGGISGDALLVDGVLADDALLEPSKMTALDEGLGGSSGKQAV